MSVLVLERYFTESFSGIHDAVMEPCSNRRTMEVGSAMSALTTGQFAMERGDALLRSVVTQVSRTVRSRSANEVHDLRVAIRRFMRILVVLKPCLPRGESRRIRRGLKRIMSQAGSVRDHDIAIRLLAKLALPESGSMSQRFQEGRGVAAQALSASLQRWGERNLAAAWRNALGAQKDHGMADARFSAASIGATARRIVPQMLAELFRLGKNAAREGASAKELHKFRIAAKDFRYTLDLLKPLDGTASVSRLLVQLKGIQTVLGDINDCAAVRRMLSRGKASTQEGGKEILSALRKRQRKKTEQFRRNFAADLGADTLRRWKEDLRQVGRKTQKTAVRPTGKRRPS